MRVKGSIAPEFYYTMVTMHGTTIIVFFVLTAGQINFQ